MQRIRVIASIKTARPAATPPIIGPVLLFLCVPLSGWVEGVAETALELEMRVERLEEVEGDSEEDVGGKAAKAPKTWK